MNRTKNWCCFEWCAKIGKYAKEHAEMQANIERQLFHQHAFWEGERMKKRDELEKKDPSLKIMREKEERERIQRRKDVEAYEKFHGRHKDCRIDYCYYGPSPECTKHVKHSNEKHYHNPLQR